MKRRSRHATRTILGIGPRRHPEPAPGQDLAGRLYGLLRIGSRSALSLAIGGLMMIFIGLLVANFIGQVIQSSRLESQRADLEAEVAQIRADNAEIEGGVAYTESDVYAERVAREQLGYAREGDIVILPRIAAPVATTPAQAPAEELAPLPEQEQNWRLWWQAIFSNSA